MYCQFAGWRVSVLPDKTPCFVQTTFFNLINIFMIWIDMTTISIVFLWTQIIVQCIFWTLGNGTGKNAKSGGQNSKCGLNYAPITHKPVIYTLASFKTPVGIWFYIGRKGTWIWFSWKIGIEGVQFNKPCSNFDLKEHLFQIEASPFDPLLQLYALINWQKKIYWQNC